jgi:hypothetical protein
MKNAKLERRKFLAAGAATLAAPGLAAPAVAQSAKTATLKFVPQANLTLLDPILTTAADGLWRRRLCRRTNLEDRFARRAEIP